MWQYHNKLSVIIRSEVQYVLSVYCEISNILDLYYPEADSCHFQHLFDIVSLSSQNEFGKNLAEMSALL